VQGVKTCKSSDEILVFVKNYEEMHRQEIENYVKKMDEYYSLKYK